MLQRADQEAQKVLDAAETKAVRQAKKAAVEAQKVLNAAQAKAKATHTQGWRGRQHP